MPREAKLFSSSSGSVVRGFLKFRANIPPRWIKNARTSCKRVEPEVVRNLRTLKKLIKNRPHARVAIKDARKELKAVLQRWEVAYNKESFYRGIRILLELQRSFEQAHWSKLETVQAQQPMMINGYNFDNSSTEQHYVLGNGAGEKPGLPVVVVQKQSPPNAVTPR